MGSQLEFIGFFLLLRKELEKFCCGIEKIQEVEFVGWVGYLNSNNSR
jgi:hypothetical protein